MVDDSKIDLIEISRALWEQKWLIFIITTLFGVASIIYAKSIPRLYKSEVKLSITEEGGGSGLSGLANSFGGLASIAGLSLDNGNSTLIKIETLKSRKFISSFINNRDLYEKLFAVVAWNPSSDEFMFNESLYDKSTGAWNNDKPSIQKAYDKFYKSHFNIIQDRKSGIIALSVSHISPNVSNEWASWLISDFNAYMREQDIQKAKKSIEYLEKQIALTNISEMKSIFYQLIEEQTKKIMLAKVSDEYVFKVIDPSVAPEYPYQPNRVSIVLVGLFIGFILSLSLVLIRKHLK